MQFGVINFGMTWYYCCPYRTLLHDYQKNMASGGFEQLRPLSTREQVQALRTELAALHNRLDQDQQGQSALQQQLVDVVIVRRGRGRFACRLPDGLEGLWPHNLVTFKSHHEALDGWAVKELVGADVAYRKLVSPAPSQLLPDEQFDK